MKIFQQYYPANRLRESLSRTLTTALICLCFTVAKASTDTVPASYDDCLLEINYEMKGTVSEFGGLSKIDWDSVWKFEYIMPELAFPVYGDKAREGLIAIITKSMALRRLREDPERLYDIEVDMSIKTRKPIKTENPIIDSSNMVLYEVEVSAEFPGGEKGWVKYIQKEIEKHIDELSDCRDCAGTCSIKFIVDIDGTVRDAIPENMFGSKLAEFAVNAIMNGPKWKPAYQNGKPVKAYKRQNITINVPN
jgi:hypothetical protein